MHTFTLDHRQFSAVLAGLRLVQAELPRGEHLPHGVTPIFDADGDIEPLNLDELDDLCEAINCSTSLPTSTDDEDETREIGIFGCKKTEIDTFVGNSLAPLPIAAMSILSDVQEEIERGMAEKARKHINVVKYIMMEYLVEKPTDDSIRLQASHLEKKGA